MILMALDHTMGIIAHKRFTEIWAMPVPDYGTLLAFFTRFVTHTCAPGFALIMGAGMIFFATSRRSAGWSEARIIRYYWIRAMILVTMMLTVELFVWAQVYPPGPDTPPVFLLFGVLFSLAGSMALGSLLLRVPSAALAALGAGLALFTQWIVPAHLSYQEAIGTINLPMMFSFVPFGKQIPPFNIFVLYPILPWFVFTLFGMILARLIQANRAQTGKMMPLAGAALVASFLLVRVMGGFGNFHPIEGEGLIAFLAVNKYPPSLAYMLLFSGINLLVISFFSHAGEFWWKAENPLQVFGKCPFFFYFLHLYFFMILGKVLKMFVEKPGYPLAYTCWALGLVLLYWPCRAFVKLKGRSSPDSIIRLF
jgi:uncharacterized membrane protein